VKTALSEGHISRIVQEAVTPGLLKEDVASIVQESRKVLQESSKVSKLRQHAPMSDWMYGIEASNQPEEKKFVEASGVVKCKEAL
jgi:hypothetical protein